MTPRPTAADPSIRRPARLAVAAACCAVVCGTLAWLAPASTASADYPTPTLAPQAWEFDFDWRQPKRVVLKEPDGELRAYWYLPYTVTNDTEQERYFLPEIVMLTKDGELLPANDNIPMGAFYAIKNRTPSLPLVPPQQVSGKLLIGEDRARSGVAIWREPSSEMGTFSLFVGGLSGQVERITNSKGEELKDEEGNPLLVRKTKQLTFRVLGDDVDTANPDVVKLEEERWVMR